MRRQIAIKSPLIYRCDLNIMKTRSKNRRANRQKEGAAVCKEMITALV